jgi:hypothetical protein
MLPRPQNYFGRPLLKSWLTPCSGVPAGLYTEKLKNLSISSRLFLIALQ